MKKFSIAAVAALAFIPGFVFAAIGDGGLGNIENLVEAIGRIVDLATPIVVGIALLVFFWGLVKFIFAQGNEDAKEQGKRLMIGGVIALFVIVSVVGIINFIGDAIGVDQGGSLPVPTVEN